MSNPTLNAEESAKVIEAKIRKVAKKPTGELTEADLEKVTELHLSNNLLAEVPKELEKLTQLKYLHLDKNKLTNVKGLEKLTQLKTLNLRSNRLTEVPKELEKLTQLTSLELGVNQLTSLKGLENLTQLKTLSLKFSQLADVKGLVKLDQLEVLDLSYNPALTKAQIDELKKALPKCNIIRNSLK